MNTPKSTQTIRLKSLKYSSAQRAIAGLPQAAHSFPSEDWRPGDGGGGGAGSGSLGGASSPVLALCIDITHATPVHIEENVLNLCTVTDCARLKCTMSSTVIVLVFFWH